MIASGTIIEIHNDETNKTSYYEILGGRYLSGNFRYDCITCSKTGKRFKKHIQFPFDVLNRVKQLGFVYNKPFTFKIYFEAPSMEITRNHSECQYCAKKNANPPVCCGHQDCKTCGWLESTDPSKPNGEYII